MTDWLLNKILRDREVGTEDAWWIERIGDFALMEGYGQGGDQDEADRARIMRLPSVERALIDTTDQLAAERAARSRYQEKCEGMAEQAEADSINLDAARDEVKRLMIEVSRLRAQVEGRDYEC